MMEYSQVEYGSTALNADLLATPFKVRTHWHVITGAPSCGKTTLIDLLADQGYETAPEGARIYLEREITKGRTLEEIRSDRIAVQCGIREMHLEIERGLPPEAFIFLDRGVPDCLAWDRAIGLDPNVYLPECFHFQYASVFLLERLPYTLDGLRYEEENLQEFTETWHIRDYNALGYPVVIVPVLPPQERVAFVLNALSARGWI